MSPKNNVNSLWNLWSITYLKSVPSTIECFYFERIHSWIFQLLACMQLLIRASRSATRQRRNSYSNSRFSPRGSDRTWVKRRGISPWKRGPRASRVRNRRPRFFAEDAVCLERLFAHNLANWASPDRVLRTGVSTVNRLTVILES